jgi:hypothetical protein
MSRRYFVLFATDQVATKLLQTGASKIKRPTVNGSIFRYFQNPFDWGCALARWGSLVGVGVSIEKLTTSSSGEYLIFDQKTGQKIFVTLPGVSAKRGSQAVFNSILNTGRGPHVLQGSRPPRTVSVNGTEFAVAAQNVSALP